MKQHKSEVRELKKNTQQSPWSISNPCMTSKIFPNLDIAGMI